MDGLDGLRLSSLFLVIVDDRLQRPTMMSSLFSHVTFKFTFHFSNIANITHPASRPSSPSTRHAHRRMAPVAPLEIRTLLGLYAVTVTLKAITIGVFLQLGSNTLTALHAGFLAPGRDTGGA
ncbi:hypothetical protein H0H87_003376 [Tephrocybe sp. NHM501043]|nr:hypothetical protein H0H87_003376 [Tephrocybe sp. NHM501043]